LFLFSLGFVPQKKLIPYGNMVGATILFFLLEENPLLLGENSLFIGRSCFLGQFNPLLLKINYPPNQFNFLLPKGSCSFSP